MDPEPIAATAAAAVDPPAAAVAGDAPAKKYWEDRPGIAPIKSEFVLWDKMKAGQARRAADDDAAEGRSSTASRDAPVPQTTLPVAVLPTESGPTSGPTTPAAAPTEPPAPAPAESGPAGVNGEGEPEVKKVRMSGAQKKKAALERQQREWEAKQAAKKEAAANGGGKEKKGGQNKGRKFDRNAGAGDIRLCTAVALGRECSRGDVCRFSHDLLAYLAARPADIPVTLPTTADDLTPSAPQERACPIYDALGQCLYGFKCRFLASHSRAVPPTSTTNETGERVEVPGGFRGCGLELVVDEQKMARVEAERAASGDGLGQLSEKLEMNLIRPDTIKAIRTSSDKEQKFPLSKAYLDSIGEPLDAREGKDDQRGKGGKGKRGRGGSRNDERQQQSDALVDAADVEADMDDIPAPAAKAEEKDADMDADPSRTYVPDLARVRAVEKKRLDFRGKTYLAPLTTVGNLPFRRLAVKLGCDITVSEMGLAQEFLSGNANEWSLVRRHPSEKLFGIQVCGSRPQMLVPTAEALKKTCEMDFVDVNCGCPIDLVFNKGAGSALLQHANKLGKSLVGMSTVLGEVPLTIKIRNGVVHNQPVAHKLVQRIQTEWGCSAVTLHGRSRAQRYKHLANWSYIGEVATAARAAAEEAGLPPIPFVGGGDAYDQREYWDHVEQSGVDTIMVARGGLIKPWIFTEIKERRDWDISSRERLDMIGDLCKYGLEHWGSDTMGVNTTRRFVAEALSFQHRYVPVGLLERFPVQLNERAFPFRGRDQLETLLASESAQDWIKVTEMFLGPAPEEWKFLPKHKANSTESAETQG